jgi:hypothetical protein
MVEERDGFTGTFFEEVYEILRRFFRRLGPQRARWNSDVFALSTLVFL